MPRYEQAPALVRQVVERMTDRYHPQLRDAKVTLSLLMAFPTLNENGDSTGPALSHNGYPAQAVVKIIGLKERTDGRADAEIVIDGDNWPLLSSDQQDALIDHELEHLELKTDKDGLLVRDDLDRPKLKLRKHDVQAGWFDAIVRRHGRNSPEFRQFEEFEVHTYKVKWLPYLDEPDQTRVEAEPIKEAGVPTHEPLDTSAQDDGTITVVDHGRPVQVAKESVGEYIIDRAREKFGLPKTKKRGGFAGKSSGGKAKHRKAAARA